jgi:hypothetical protein
VVIERATTRKTPARSIEPIRAHRTPKDQRQFDLVDEDEITAGWRMRESPVARTSPSTACGRTTQKRRARTRGEAKDSSLPTSMIVAVRQKPPCDENDACRSQQHDNHIHRPALSSVRGSATLHRARRAKQRIGECCVQLLRECSRRPSPKPRTGSGRSIGRADEVFTVVTSSLWGIGRSLLTSAPSKERTERDCGITFGPARINTTGTIQRSSDSGPSRQDFAFLQRKQDSQAPPAFKSPRFAQSMWDPGDWHRGG